MKTTIDDIALTFIPKVGPRTAAWLIECFGSAAEVFGAGMGELIEKAGLNERIAKAIARKESHKKAEKEAVFCEEHGIIPLAATSQEYPELLKECGDHPHVVYYKGDLQALKRRAVSMVGTRSITQYGQRACDLLAGELAALLPDAVIVSGLSFGIDGACPRAAMAHGLATVAVLPTPLRNV